MSIVSQNNTNEVALIDCIQRFFSNHQVGKLLKKCNGTKEKGVPAISLLKYKLGNIFTDRSMYMQQKTGSFLASDIVNNDLKKLTDEKRTNVFIVDDSRQIYVTDFGTTSK